MAHPGRGEDPPLQHLREGTAVEVLANEGQEVVSKLGVLESRAGLEEEPHASDQLDELAPVVPEPLQAGLEGGNLAVVPEAGGVSQQLTDRDPRPRLPGKPAEPIRQGSVQRQLPFLDQLEHHDRRERLGQRSDHEPRVVGVGDPPLPVREADEPR